MNLRRSSVNESVCYAATALPMAAGTTPLIAQPVSGIGNLYCIVSSTANFCGTASVNITNGSTSSGAALDASIVDSTVGKIFSEAIAAHGTTTESVLTGCESSGTHEGCIMSFIVPSSGSVLNAPHDELSPGGNREGASGIMIDNVSTQAGASRVYFSNLQDGDAMQASQSGLQ